jgi:twitching motility protein PilT
MYGGYFLQAVEKGVYMKTQLAQKRTRAKHVDTIEVEELLKLVIDRKASDLHLTVPSCPVLRIDGLLVPQSDFPPLLPDDIETILRQITTEEQRITFEREHELDIAFSISGLGRFRTNAIKQRGSTSLAFRVVPYNIPTIDELGLPQLCKELILKPRGLILVTGPAGSGKSTTLAAMVNHLNENCQRNVVTIEDPIEFLFSNNKCIIRQREVGSDTKSFAQALKHCLRHDPDVIVIGEMRDLATISTAISAAETGHLILGTLHTYDAAQSIDRMVDVFPPGQQRQVRLQLSQVLEAVLSQTLLPRAGGGRIVACEVMLTNSVIKRMIREEKIYEITASIEMGSKEGSQSMNQALASLVSNNLVAEGDALLRSSDPARLNELLKPPDAGFC